MRSHGRAPVPYEERTDGGGSADEPAEHGTGRAPRRGKESRAGLAHRVNDLGTSLGLNYDYTALYRWIEKGEIPRGSVPALIAQALSEKLGRTITIADIGMARTDASAADLGLHYADQVDDASTAVANLWTADLQGLDVVTAAPVAPTAWTDASLSWLVRTGSDPLPARSSGRRIGTADVAAIRATIDLFAAMDNQFGGNHARRPLIQYLHTDLAPQLAGRYTDATGQDLFRVASEATLLTAWMSYDAGHFGLAQRYFIQALRLAQAANDPLLAASVLDAMSHQATFLGRHREAATLARAALTGTRGHATATLTAHFHAMEARALAAAGDAPAAEHVLSQAVRAFDQRHPDDDPPWIRYVDEAELAAEFGHCYRDLQRHRDAIRHATQALTHSGASARSDFFVTMVLAEAQLGANDVDEACRITRAALDAAGQLKSARCAEYVRRFRQQLARYQNTEAARELAEYAADHPLWTADD